MITTNDLNKIVRIVNGDDFGKEGKLIRVYLNEKKFTVVQFNDHEYGLYDLTQIEIL